MSITNYIKELQGIEEYGFSWNEILENVRLPLPTLRKELVRLAKKNEIMNLRQGFYLIIPPRYASFGKLPIQLFVAKLFKYLEKKYYIGLYSAATIHGASHQRIQQDYVVIDPPALRDIERGNTKIRFFQCKNWPRKNLFIKKSDAGLYNLSSPALTALDLIHHQSKLGGINRMLANLQELSELITDEDILSLLLWYPYKSTLQRFGYLMDQVAENTVISEVVFDYLSQELFYPVLLTPDKKVKPGHTGNRWKVGVNIKLENDL